MLENFPTFFPASSPGYNCEKQIGRVLLQLDQEVMDYIAQVIVVNNRSTDNTEEAVRMFQGEHPEIPIKLLRNCESIIQ